MKRKIPFSKRTYGFKTLVAFLTCFMFIVFPSCQKDGLDQVSEPDIDLKASKNSSVVFYYGPVYITQGIKNVWISDVNFENFADSFVLKVKRSGMVINKILIEVYINGDLVITSSDFRGKEIVSKTLKKFSNPAELYIPVLSEDITLWIEASTIPASPLKPGMIRDVEGNLYKTVQIGDFWLMAENLRTTRYNDGNFIIPTPSPSSPPVPEVNPPVEPRYYWYDQNPSAYRADYGALYNWYAVNNGKLCPTGWHVPNDKEWYMLELTIDPTTIDGGGGLGVQSLIAGGMLKEMGNVHWTSPNGGATDDYGFKALPGGGYYLKETAMYQEMGTDGYYWTSTEAWVGNDWWGFNRELTNLDGTIEKVWFPKHAAISVRCVKDYAK